MAGVSFHSKSKTSVWDGSSIGWNGWYVISTIRHHIQIYILAHTNLFAFTSVVFGGLDEQQRATDVLSTIVFTSKGFDWSDRDSTMRQQPWPAARYGHSMCLCANDQVAVFGGHDSSGTQLTELWLLNANVLASCDVVSNRGTLWTKVDPKAYYTQPKPKTTPSIAHLDGKIFLFGQTLRSRGEVDLFNLTSHK